MVNFCAIVGCSNKSTKDTSITLYRFPQISKHAKSAEQELQKKRRALWIERIKRDDVKEGNINYFRICANHFLKGRPADLLDEDNPDWAPCINLGYKTVYDKQKKINNDDSTPHNSDVENHDGDNDDTAEEEVNHEDNNSVHDDNSNDEDGSVIGHDEEEKSPSIHRARSIVDDIIEEKNSSDDDSVQCHERTRKSHDDLRERDDHELINEKKRKDDDNVSDNGSPKHHDSDIKNYHSQNYIDLGNNLIGRSDGSVNKNKSPSNNHEKVVKKHHRNDSTSSDNDSLKHKDNEVKHHHHHGNSYIDLGNNLIGRSINTSRSDTIVVNDESPRRHDRGFKNNRVHDARNVENNLKNHKKSSDDDDVTMKDGSKNKRRQQVEKVVKAVKTNPLPAAKRQFLNAQSLITKRMAAGAVSPERSPQRKPLDVNKYATKKTIAQGMLDIALLTANASQLKYILQVGEKHEFYSLMLALISISIILQVAVAVLSILLTQFDVSKDDQDVVTEVLNHASLGFSLLAMVSDVIKMSFGLDPALSFKDFDRYRNITRK